MKKYIIPGIFVACIVLFSGCNVHYPLFEIPAFSEEESEYPEDDPFQPVEKPSDVVEDIFRSSSRTFSFETLLPARLNIHVDFYS